MIWSSPSFKGLFLPKGKLSSLVFNFNLPGTFSDIAHKPIVLSLNIIGQTGTAILLTIVITILMSKKVNFGDAGRLFGVTFKELGYQSLLFALFWQSQKLQHMVD